MKKTSVKKWFKPSFGDEDRFKIPSNDHSTGLPVKKSKTAKSTIKLNKTFDLIDEVVPKSVTDLAVHSKKINEVESWLVNNILTETNKISVLVINGPTGAGKTATVRVLCKTMNIRIIEWINPADIEIEEFRGPGQMVRFSEFLMQSSRYPSLLTTNTSKKVIVVEDFPNAIVYKPTEFESILDGFFSCGKAPAIFICTDTSDNSMNLAQKLFPETVRNKYAITSISFNPATDTNLKSALKRIGLMLKEKQNDQIYQIPGPETLDSIINTAMGDIRSAINYYNFACLKGSADLPVTISLESGTKRKRKDNKSTLSNMARDETLGLLHGVGRVLYPKRVQSAKFWKLKKQPETIVDQFLTIPSMFVSFLHENYLRYYGDFSNVSEASALLSFAETFMTDWQDKDAIMLYGLWIGIMGLMIHNEHPVTKWNPVQGPKHLKKTYKPKSLTEPALDSVDIGYYNIINKIPSRFSKK